MGASNTAKKRPRQEPCPVTARFGHCWLLNAVEVRGTSLVSVQLQLKPHHSRGDSQLQLGDGSFMNLECFGGGVVVSTLLEGLAPLPHELVLPRSSCLPHHMTVV